MKATGKKDKRRFRLLRRMLIACVALIVVFLLGVFVALPELARRGHLNPAVEEALGAILGAETKAGRIDVSPASEVVVHEVRAFHPGDSAPFLTVDRLVIGGDIASIMSGRYSRIEASGVWVKITVENGRPDWLPPAQEKGYNIPVFDIRNAGADVDIDGISLRLRDAQFTLTDFGGDSRTQIDGRARLGRSPSWITLSGNFLMDDLPGSAVFDLGAADINLRDLPGVVDALNAAGVEAREGLVRLRLSMDAGKVFAEISLSDFTAGLTGKGAGALRGDLLLGLKYDLRRETLAVSPESDNYVVLNGLGRLDITPGSFLSLGDGAPFLDFRAAASGVNIARGVSSLFAPDDAPLKEMRLSGNLTAREIHVSGPLDNLEAEIDSELDDVSFAGYGASVTGLSGPVRIKGAPAGGITMQVRLHANRAGYDYCGNVAADENVEVSGALRLDPAEFTLEADITLTLSKDSRFRCSGAVGLSDGRLDRVRVESVGEVDAQRTWSIVQRLFLPEMKGMRLEGKTEGRALIDTFRGEDGRLRYVVSWSAALAGCNAHVPFLGKPVEGLRGGIGAEIITGQALEEMRNITAELSSPQFERVAVSRGLYRPAPPAEPEGRAYLDLAAVIKARRNRDALEILLGRAPDGDFLKEMLDWDARLEIAAAGTPSEFAVSLNSLTMTNAPARKGKEPLRSFTMEGVAANFRREGDSLRVTAAVPELDVDEIWSRMRHMFPEWLRPARFRGTIHVNCEMDLKEDGAWSGDITLSAEHGRPVRAFRYYTPGGEGRFLLGNTKITMRLEQRPGSDVSLDAAVSVDGFQYLHSGESAFCLDMARQPADIETRLLLKDGGEALRLADTHVKIKDVGEVSVSGALGLDPARETNLSVTVGRL
ncbi:MAG: hypothetical protein DRP79_08570, partial [Planctomycetota bacterium]